MNRFTIPKKNRWNLGDTYMPFFIWHNKVYPVGVPVTLTELGKGAIAHRYEIFSVTLKAHYFDRHLEKWSYCYDGQNQHVFPYKNLNGIEYSTCFGTPDEYIASVEAEPLDVNVQEYLDFIKNHTENYYDRHLTFEEEVKKGAYISTRVSDVTTRGKEIVISAVGEVDGRDVREILQFVRGTFLPAGVDRCARKSGEPAGMVGMFVGNEDLRDLFRLISQVGQSIHIILDGGAQVNGRVGRGGRCGEI